MWKVGEKNTMKVGCNSESNFPISIELRFSVSSDGYQRAANNHGMWFGADDAKYLISELERAVKTIESAEQLAVADYHKAPPE